MHPFIERHRHLLDFVLSTLWRRKGRNAALLAVYISIVFFLGSALFLTTALRFEADHLLAGSPEIVVQRILLGRFAPVPLHWQEKIQEIRGVAEVKSRLWGYYFDPYYQSNYTLIAEDDSEQESGTITLGPSVANQRKSAVGDTIFLVDSQGQYQPYEVSRILDQGTSSVSADLILMNIADYRELSGMAGDVATDITIKVRNRKELSTVLGKIVGLYPDARPISREQIARTYDAIFGWRGGVMLLALSAAGSAFLFLVWDRATGLSAEERKEIGILKAVGWETSDILLLKFQEGGVISGVAFLVGSLLAYVHVFVLDAPLIAPLFQGWSVLSTPFHLTPTLDFYTLSILAALTILPYIAVTIVPSWRVAITDPDSVMR